MFVFVKKLCHSVAVRWVLPLSDEVILHAKKLSIASGRLMCVCFEKRKIGHAMGMRWVCDRSQVVRGLRETHPWSPGVLIKPGK